MKKYLNELLVLFLLFCCIEDISAQKNYLKLYKDKVTDTSLVPIEAGINYLILKDKKGRFVLQNYYYETLNMYRQTTYKNKELTIRHGAMIWKDDEGNLLEEGLYANGRKASIWKHYAYTSSGTYLSSYGTYVNDLKEGLWVTTDTLGIKIKEELYTDGILAKATEFEPDGTEKPVLIPVTPDTAVQKMPSFSCLPLFEKEGDRCGEVSLQMYLRDNINYPVRARDLYIMGDAYLSFVIEKDGSVTRIHVINGISDDIKKECVRIVSKMPKWIPGQANGLPVKVKFTLPIRFRLE
jgi:TonB family protein